MDEGKGLNHLSEPLPQDLLTEVEEQSPPKKHLHSSINHAHQHTHIHTHTHTHTHTYTHTHTHTHTHTFNHQYTSLSPSIYYLPCLQSALSFLDAGAKCVQDRLVKINKNVLTKKAKPTDWAMTPLTQHTYLDHSSPSQCRHTWPPPVGIEGTECIQQGGDTCHLEMLHLFLPGDKGFFVSTDVRVLQYLKSLHLCMEENMNISGCSKHLSVRHGGMVSFGMCRRYACEEVCL